MFGKLSGKFFQFQEPIQLFRLQELPAFPEQRQTGAYQQREKRADERGDRRDYGGYRGDVRVHDIKHIGLTPLSFRLPRPLYETQLGGYQGQ